MKKILTLFILTITIGYFATSCKKETFKGGQNNRTIKFLLYTNKDFSNNTDSINFTIRVRNENKTIEFDSLVKTIRIKDIPGPANKFVFTKAVPDDGTVLTAGFLYNIKNVGISWYLDTVGVTRKEKTIEFAFQ
ncbi:MAG: hypothetical protein EOP47_08110 [Sphingobacteriaceae bacterium]|nr:MAG: hypothetical protein EOP47_08110 [Sphingobacteriaceae bacterium]